MKEIVTLINKYIGLQGSCFGGERVVCYLKTSSKRSVKEVITDGDLITRVDFAVILIFQSYKIIITSGHSRLEGFAMYNMDDLEVQEDLSYVLFLCEKDKLCFWSRELSMLVDVVRGFGGDCVVLNKNLVLHGYAHYNIVAIQNYAPISAVNEQFVIFNEYMLSTPLGYHTKDSDFLFKTVFNDYWCRYPRDTTLVHYFQRVYTSFVYGYIKLPDGDKTTRNLTLYNFWFEDLYSIQGCDTGVGHIRCFEFGQFDEFYFVLACSNKETTLSGLELLQGKYEITVMEYDKTPTCFVSEFMHYEAEVAYFNTYFIGVFNRESWVLFVEVFQKISATLTESMGCAEYALHSKDIYTIEEKYRLRFGFFIYVLTRAYSVEEAYTWRKVLPWFALPEWLIELQERKSKIDVLDV